ncbi:caspase-8 [Embiotoca jacksoni]|uniref:caspase-8 n=1 Tax=Embiotoca jacksoni TaxID=100190 RepID=UPI003704A7AB
MDRLKLSRIDDELDSSEVAALCFLCLDVVNRKRLEGIKDAKDLFLRLEEKGLLENDAFLSQLLNTICRPDLLKLLETDSRQREETDAYPVLSYYRVMLYKIHEDMVEENLDKMKFLLTDKLGRRQIEKSDTVLDVFSEMEKQGLMSKTNVNELHAALLELDQQMASTVEKYRQGLNQQHQHTVPPDASMDYQVVTNNPQPQQQPQQHVLSMSETQPSKQSIYSDSQPTIEPYLSDEKDYYTLTRKPRGSCVIINNELFEGPLNPRGGTQMDADSLNKVFTRFGFTVVIHDNLTAENMRYTLTELGKKNFINDDVLVVCVLSHGENGCVFGTDGQKVYLQELTIPFKSDRARTLAGKPKLFFIQACQGKDYQTGSMPCSAMQEVKEQLSHLEADAGPLQDETVPSDADFLLGMSTVPNCKSFRNTSTGSVYIQELCKQLVKSAESSAIDDILTVLTRVNGEISKGTFLYYKQMPEPKYTLTKKLVLKYVNSPGSE